MATKYSPDLLNIKIKQRENSIVEYKKAIASGKKQFEKNLAAAEKQLAELKSQK